MGDMQDFNPYSSTEIFRTLNDIVDFYAETKPKELAYRFISKHNPDKTINYLQLQKNILSLATNLPKQLVKGDRVILAAQPGLEFIIGFFACARIGAIAVPVFPPINTAMASRFLHIYENAKPKLVLCDREVAKKMHQGTLVNTFLPKGLKKWLGINAKLASVFDILKQANIPLIAVENLCHQPIISIQSPVPGPKDAVFIQYTSGSTDNPKGVVLTHHNLLDNMAIIKKVLRHDEQSHMFSWLPPYHDMGLIAGILEPLYAGIPSTLMATQDFIIEPMRWLEAMSTYRCTSTGAPNFAYELCSKRVSDADLARIDLSNLRVAANGAEPISYQVMHDFYQKFAKAGLQKGTLFPCYGMAETTVMVSAHRFMQEAKVLHLKRSKLQNHQVELSDDEHDQQILVSSGIPQMEVKIVDFMRLTELAEGEIGEIWIRGASVSEGYFNNPKASEETFKNALNSLDKIYLRSGDLGFLYQGELFVCGRLKNLIILHGKNYYPQDIELATASAHPAIRTGCVVAYQDYSDTLKEHLVIAAELKKDVAAQDYDSILHSIAERVNLALEVSPGRVILLPAHSLPKTTSGKLQRNALAMQLANNELTILREQCFSTVYEIPTLSHEDYADFFKQLQELPKDQREPLVWRYLQTITANLLGISNPDDIDLDRGFFSLGFNSIKAVEMKALLENIFDNAIPLDNSILFHHPNIRKLGRYLLESHQLIEKENHVTPTENDAISLENTSIAIVGMSGTFPGSQSLEEFWRLIATQENVTKPFPVARWGRLMEEAQKCFGSTPKAGTLDSLDEFDARFFHVAPKNAKYLDPQQRLILMNSWHAIENAGINPDLLRGSKTGVYIGFSNHDYETHILANMSVSALTRHVALGNCASTVAGRIAHFYGLQGPCMTIDTACSSSLVAVYEACQSLKSGKCNLAFAGGVNAIITPHLFVNFMKSGMLSTKGSCSPFDKAADGYVRGEGCGLVVLKRLEDAVADKDYILAVIDSSAVNQDGASSGLTVPNGEAQRMLLEQALQEAHCQPDDIDWVECHATGTKLGDPIEVSAIQVAYRARLQSRPIHVRSLKANIGHLEAGAGIASLIKVLLAFENNTIPGQANFNEQNPSMIYDQIEVSKTNIDWIPRPQAKRRAAINSFGFSGTNAHVILSEYRYNKSYPQTSFAPPYLFVLSAKKEGSLRLLIEQYRKFLKNTSHSLLDISYTLATGRTHFSYRIAIIASDKVSLAASLANFTIHQIKPSSDLEPIDSRDLATIQTHFLAGKIINWQALFSEKAQKVPLPLYCFEREIYWFDGQQDA